MKYTQVNWGKAEHHQHTQRNTYNYIIKLSNVPNTVKLYKLQKSFLKQIQAQLKGCINVYEKEKN